MSKITSKYADLFKHDAEIVKALETVRKAGLATAEAKDALIRRTVAFAYEQKNSDLVNGAAKWLESEGFRDVSAAYAFTLETTLSGLIPCAAFEGRVIYAPAWKDHDAVCRKLKAAKPYQEWKATKDAEKAAKKESRPAEIIERYSPDCHSQTSAKRIATGIDRLIKANESDAKALKGASLPNKEKALAYLKDENTALTELKELCNALHNRGISFREIKNKLDELNA